LDAACIGYIDIIKKWEQPTLIIECKGRGQRQRTLLDKYGFPRAYLTRQKRHLGFQTGDMVKAVVTTGKRIGKYFGRVSVRKSGYFSISGVIDGVSHRFFTILQRSDGYSYSIIKIAN